MKRIKITENQAKLLGITKPSKQGTVIKITLEQYNRLIKEDNTRVKGGLGRVDKTFRVETQKVNIKNFTDKDIKSEEEDFIYIKTLFYTRGVKSEKQLTLEGYKAYISKNANKQDNLDKLINFIIDGIKNAKPIYVTDVHNKNYYIKVFLEDINSIKKPELKIATALKTVYDIKGGNNKQYKEILGKRRRIYKIKGSRKEHVKYKGELIPVSDYKKLFKK